MKKILTGTTIGSLLLFAGAAIALAVGSNGSFENGTDPGSFATLSAGDNSTINDWTVQGGGVDYIGSYWTASNGSRSIDLSAYTPGSVEQNLTTVVGATYTVTFDMSGNPENVSDTDNVWYSPSNKTMDVTANGASLTSYSYDTVANGNDKVNMKWQQMTYTFVASTTTTTLKFTSTTPGAFGPALDNVQITEILNTFPVPAQCDQNIVYNHIVGTSRAENINGTSGDDLIEGMGGADRIDGKGGNDCIVGGSAADTLTGGLGNDVLLGLGGADTLYGNAGMDKLYGGDGADTMYGGADNDYIEGGAAADRAYGEGGSSDTCIAEVRSSCEL